MSWFRSHRSESGAVAVIMAIVICVVLIPLAGLAVDIGMQRVARRDMQAVADAAALDLGRALGAGQTPTVAAAVQSAASTGGVVGGVQTAVYNTKQVSVPQMAVFTGYIAPGATFVSDQSLGCDGSPYNSYFTAVPAGKAANAVLVTASGKATFNLVPGSGGVCRSAIGNARLEACMMMDSYAAALNTGNSAILGLLDERLGTSLNLQLLSSSGILTANLDVLSFLNILKTQLGVGGFDEVLTTNVTAAQVIAAEVAALNAQGSSAMAQVLQSQIGVHAAGGATFNVGDLLGLTTGGSSGLGAMFNPFDLASAALQLANGNEPVKLDVASSVLSNFKLSLKVGSRPTPVCLGEGTKTMGQTTVTATVDVVAPNTVTGVVSGLVTSVSGLLSGVLNLLGGALGGDTYDLPVITLGNITAQVSLASASGSVTSLNCSGGQPTSMLIKQGSTLVPATISLPLVIKETRHYGGFLGVGRKTETVTSTFTLTATTAPSASSSVDATLAIPGDYGKPKAGPSGNLSVGDLVLTPTMTSDGVFSNGKPLVGTMLGGLTKVLESIQEKLLGPLLTGIVTPLLNGLTSAIQTELGLTVAGSTYMPVPTPNCGTPKLAG